MTRAKISVILPTLNEEETIGRVIDEIPRAALEEAGYAVQVLVVDGNSQDRTRQLPKIKVLKLWLSQGRARGGR